jgi:hypothetical protein
MLRLLTDPSERRAARNLLAMALAAVATAVVALGHTLLGQAGTSDAVLYKQCYRPPARVVFGRFPECGVEAAASSSSLPSNDGFFCYRADGTPTTSRGECANVPVPARTPEQERAIIQHIEEQRAEEKRAQRQADLLDALENASQTVAKYADAKVIVLTAAQKASLDEQRAWLASQIKTGKLAKFTLSEMTSISIVLKQRLANVREIIEAARESLATTVPPIENIMLRIDDLVRRVGTVIGSLEKEGTRVPLQVKRGYERAKAGMTIAQRNCSPRRPQNCFVLHDVLDAIEAMRTPLCALPSDKLTICRQ